MITNQSQPKIRRMLTPERSVLYEPKAGDWTYSHHPSLCSFNGRLYASWSNGRVNEDDIGQRVLCSVANGGVWSEPFVLFDSMPGTGVLTAAGFHSYGNTLAAYAGYYAYIESGSLKHKDTALFVKTTSDGVNWSEMRNLDIPVVPNQGPQKLASGRLLICGNVTFPYSDDPTGLSGWTMSGLPPFPWDGIFDDSEGFWIHRDIRGDGRGLCEGSYYQTSDGVLHMLLRSHENWLFESESADNGATWSAPEKTQFTDCGTKFHCGRLPDGRFYIVGSPDPACNRCPLVISISRDGEIFDCEYVIDGEYRELRIPGRWKGGIYGYPHTYIDGNIMYVICSVNKEDVYVYSFPLDKI